MLTGSLIILFTLAECVHVDSMCAKQFVLCWYHGLNKVACMGGAEGHAQITDPAARFNTTQA